MKKYFELFLDNCTEAHLDFIYHIVKYGSWGKKIENLTLDTIYDEAYDEVQIRISGWSTKKNWENFCNIVIYDDKFDYLYKA